jgi:hypothetical protein
VWTLRRPRQFRCLSPSGLVTPWFARCSQSRKGWLSPTPVSEIHRSQLRFVGPLPSPLHHREAVVDRPPLAEHLHRRANLRSRCADLPDPIHVELAEPASSNTRPRSPIMLSAIAARCPAFPHSSGPLNSAGRSCRRRTGYFRSCASSRLSRLEAFNPEWSQSSSTAHTRAGNQRSSASVPRSFSPPGARRRCSLPQLSAAPIRPRLRSS